MTNQALIERFIQGDKLQGHNQNSTIFYTADMLYSYGLHYAIARLYRDRKIAFLNSRYYSPTTAKHVANTQRALHLAGYSIIQFPFDTLLPAEYTAWLESEKAQYAEKAYRARTNKWKYVHYQEVARITQSLIDLQGVL